MAKRKRQSKKKARKQRRPKPQAEPLPPIPDRRAIPGFLDAKGAGGSGTVGTASGELPLRLSWVEEA